jgi:hypothetical protein
MLTEWDREPLILKKKTQNAKGFRQNKIADDGPKKPGMVRGTE